MAIFPLPMDYYGICAQRVKGLGHADLNVRSEMLRIISDEAKVSEDATGIVIAQIGKYGWEEAYQYSHQVGDLPHTEESLAWVCAALLAPWKDCDKDRFHPACHLLRWLESAPIAWVSEHLEDLRTKLPGAPVSADSQRWVEDVQDFFGQCEQRLAADGLSEPELRRRLEEVISLCAGDEDWPDEGTEELKALCEAAGRKGFFQQAELLEWMYRAFVDGEDEMGAGFRAGSALLVAGEMGQPIAIAPIIALFGLDWDWINELIPETLKDTLDAASFAELLAVYPGLAWHARLYLSGVIEEVRFEGFEDRLQSVYRGEKDVALNTRLANALVLQGTDTGIATARLHLQKHRNFRDCESLRDIMFCQEIVLGRETDSTAKHLLRMEGERRRMEERIKSVMGMRPPSLLDSLMNEGEAPPHPMLKAPLPPAAGRNEPCPCGSGKKYKKCCG